MGFAEAIRSGFQNYVTFSGRARRAEYWWWSLFGFLLSIVGYLLDSIAFPNLDEGPIYAILSLAIFLPSVSVLVRRLHDTGRSGWWFWLALIPLIGTLILLYWMIKRGDEGSNDYGPDPIAEGTW